MNTFIPYLSIENHCHAKTVNNILKVVAQNPEVEWVATEKVHGANFQMICDGKDVRCGKRTGFLKEEDSKGFFGFWPLFEQLRPKMLRLFDLVKRLESKREYSGLDRICTEKPDCGCSLCCKEEDPITFSRPHEIETVTVYGELFGGGYPSGMTQLRCETKPVQPHIYYCPHLEFYAFDIVADWKFLDYDTSIKLWQEAGFLYAKPLKRGTFQQVYAFEVELLQSWIPAYFNLPLIESNFAEGVVIKPTNYISKKYQELFLKKKQSRFVEVHKGKPKQFDHTIQLPSTEDIQDMKTHLEDIARYMTQSRLDAVLSKEGTIDDQKRLVGLFMADVIQDWKKTESNALLITSMNKQHRNVFYNSVMTQCQKFVGKQ